MQGQLAVYPSCRGQEACEVAAVLALRPAGLAAPDLPRHRGPGAARHRPGRGADPAARLLALRLRRRRHWRIVPQCTPLATQAPHAVGLGLAAKLAGDPAVALCFFGDGATSEGDFHEACNSAAVYQAPVVFLVQNNQYAISVPLRKQTHAMDARGQGGRLRACPARGWTATTCRGLTRARRGGGPGPGRRRPDADRGGDLPHAGRTRTPTTRPATGSQAEVESWRAATRSTGSASLPAPPARWTRRWRPRSTRRASGTAERMRAQFNRGAGVPTRTRCSSTCTPRPTLAAAGPARAGPGRARSRLRRRGERPVSPQTAGGSLGGRRIEPARARGADDHGQGAQRGAVRRDGRGRAGASSSARTSASSAECSGSPTAWPREFGEERCFDTPLAEAVDRRHRDRHGDVRLSAGRRDAVRRLRLSRLRAGRQPRRQDAQPHRGRAAAADGHADPVRRRHRRRRAPQRLVASPTSRTRPASTCVTPSTVEDAYRMLRSAIDRPDPVVFFEPKRLYWSKAAGPAAGDHRTDRHRRRCAARAGTSR